MPGGLDSLRRVFGMGVDRREWEVAEDEAQPAAETVLDFLDDGVSFAAVRAFEVRVLHQRRGRRRRLLDMVAIPDRDVRACRCRSPSHVDAPFGGRFENRQDAVNTGVDADQGRVTPADGPLRVGDEQGTFADAVLLEIRSVGACDAALGFKVREDRKP